VQNWAKEMASPQSEGGCGIKSMPKKLETVEQLVEICTTIISTCSMGHAAANFQQYEAYGYPPNFPPTLRKMPPQTKVLINFFASNIFIFHTIYMIFFCVLGGNY